MSISTPDPATGLPRFESRFTAELPGDPETANERRQVLGACYSPVQPTPVPAPRLVAYAREVADRLDLPRDFCESQQFAEIMAGNRLLEGMEPYATCYGGHQFGNWAGQLGDGRAINLGEIVNARGERWVLQLKGAGPTPYSRMADGRAVLRSSVREYLCSEAMHHLGVPTTRALALVTTGEQVMRDMFYDGRPAPEPGAVLCRVAPTFTRFGSFEIFTARKDFGSLKALLDYTIRTDFPHLGEPGVGTYLRWYEEVARRTAEMIVEWMRVGFVHGVMNTDNMSVLGLTIDYGPYGWLDNYDPDWTPNTTDANGKRYRFGHQPQIALWNLAQLGNAIYPLVEQVEPLQQALETYMATLEPGFRSMMAAKLGLQAYDRETDEPLVSELQQVLQLVETDMTLFYRRLADLDVERAGGADDAELITTMAPAYYAEPSREAAERIAAWLRRYAARVESEHGEPGRRERMNRVNPKYVLRNYLAQLAIDKAEAGEYSLIDELLEVLRRPYDEQPENEAYAARRPDWARTRPGCSMLSCSS